MGHKIGDYYRNDFEKAKNISIFARQRSFIQKKRVILSEI